MAVGGWISTFRTDRCNFHFSTLAAKDQPLSAPNVLSLTSEDLLSANCLQSIESWIVNQERDELNRHHLNRMAFLLRTCLLFSMRLEFLATLAFLDAASLAPSNESSAGPNHMEK